MKIIIVFYFFPDKNIRENVTGDQGNSYDS